ncbi:TPA: hypothetical protein N0F65_008340 [Lagenidium giganteum]|uniref:Dynein light intermediate chain n=1 Tax=Lagenidium giganteum TaxID=4803 RepID=A0AAV2YT55_9STRA|nr:TPA: hypothetical protein N0F65_008340 [Lagenidium giganteum]
MGPLAAEGADHGGGRVNMSTSTQHSDAKDAKLWQQMLRDCSVRSRLPTASLVVVGDAESGKSALLARLDEKHGAAPSVSAAADADGSPPLSNEAAQHAMSSLLAFTTVDVLDPRATAGDTADDFIAKINTWTLNETKMKDLLQLALKPQDLSHMVVAVVLDLSRPWTIKSSLEQWTSALEGQLLNQINQLPVEERNGMYGRVKDHILAYEDPSIDHSVPVSIDVNTKKEFLDEGVLAKNLGVPFVIIVAKADLRTDNSVKMDYIEYTLRQFAIRYGAAVVYTSAKTSTNIDLMRKYVLHRAFPEQFKFEHAPQLVERGAIFIPSGYDSFALVEKSLVGSQPRWTNDKTFEKMVPPPTEESEDPTMMATEIRVDTHERWLEKLEKAAGAGLEELQKQSVEASKKSEAAAAARRAAADRRKREEKDVSSKHLANFFNDLLSRPEKTKSARSLTDMKKREKSGVKSLAEQELQNLAKRSNSQGSGLSAPPAGDSTPQ